MNYSICYLRAIIGVHRVIGFPSRTASSKPVKTIINSQGKDVPVKKNLENRITLIGADNSVSITNLQNAQSLSTRRDLKLVKIQDEDSKTRRPVYKLMTTADYHAEELERRKQKQAFKQDNKGEKLLTLSTRIGNHDLMTGVKKMVKLVEKQYEVRVVVAGDEANASEKLEKIFSVIESQVKSVGKIIQKRMKGNSLKFQLLPLRSNSTQEDKKESNTSNNDKGPL